MAEKPGEKYERDTKGILPASVQEIQRSAYAVGDEWNRSLIIPCVPRVSKWDFRALN